MTTYKELKALLQQKRITEAEYHAMKEAYLNRMIDLYFKGQISEEQFIEYTKEKDGNEK